MTSKRGRGCSTSVPGVALNSLQQRVPRMTPRAAKGSKMESKKVSRVVQRWSLNTVCKKTLRYQIHTLLENGIQVLIISLPHHPDSLVHVPTGQWDPMNETIERYSNLPGVTVFDQTWESGWVDEHFYDRNHLDDEGRAEFCARLAPVLEQMLED